jgi:hypothetical protein
MLLAGLFYWPKPSIPHVLFGIIAFAGGVAIWMWHDAENAPHYDEKTNRLYRFTEPSDNPHHGVCPICHDTNCQIIYTITNKRKFGVYCNRHNERWFDLEA